MGKNNIISKLRQDLEEATRNAEREVNSLRQKYQTEIEELKEFYEKALADIRLMYEKERGNQDAKLQFYESELFSHRELTLSQGQSDVEGSNPDESVMSHFSLKFSELNDK